MSKYSVGIYSTTPAAWRPDASGALQAEIDGWAAPAQARHAEGWATVETCTVKYGRDGARTGIIVGRLEKDGRRFVARSDDRDTGLVDLLAAGEPIGERVYVRSFGFGNRVTTSGPGTVDAVTHPTTAFDDLMTSHDAIEGMTASAQKRRPEWRNQ